MKLTSHAVRRIATTAIMRTAILLPAVALASGGSAATVGSPTVLLPAAALASSASASIPGHRAAAVLPPASSASGPGTHPQRRRLAVTTLSSFKAVLIATRASGTVPGPMATVTAAGYRHTSRGWKLIAANRIGKAGQWFWYSA
jgi:hypothetical protein